MEIPPRVIYPRRFHASPSQYTVAAPDLRDKLATLVDRNEKVKTAYHQLQSQIASGLAEAGEVFESLAIPLMKLVGLKTSEMESEGRHSTFIFNTERHHMDDTAQNGARSDDLNNQIRRSKEENYAAKVDSARKEIVHNHKGQLRQLVHMLRQIETQVNSHRGDIVQMLDDGRNSFQEFIQKSLYYLSSVHSRNDDTFPATVKLLRILFNNINELLGSAARLLATLIVYGSGAVIRACTQAYRQALANASKSGVAQEAMHSLKRGIRGLTEPEARQILGVTEKSSWGEVLKRYDNLFERNAKSGTFYLQSKVQRAKECLEAAYQKKP
ncbi:hypothetical protein DY000_02006171 [Brassica cretica]|uniref:Uncharacterized protein n=1 Tax=Brassica cretica TaxID=69181 RepID=A0ABQ7C865_BRACR|nr:hypothetical protein DY000_02006171 [Brassica cretica]